jgi:hypothetical protein
MNTNNMELQHADREQHQKRETIWRQRTAKTRLRWSKQESNWWVVKKRAYSIPSYLILMCHYHPIMPPSFSQNQGDPCHARQDLLQWSLRKSQGSALHGETAACNESFQETLLHMGWLGMRTLRMSEVMGHRAGTCSVNELVCCAQFAHSFICNPADFTPSVHAWLRSWWDSGEENGPENQKNGTQPWYSTPWKGRFLKPQA